MFADAIEKVGGFTRPIKFISRIYKDNVIAPGCATMFFVNDEGWALTCKHVANQIIAADQTNNRYAQFKAGMAEIAKAPRPRSLPEGLSRNTNWVPKNWPR